MAERVVIYLTGSAARDPDLDTASRLLFAMALRRRDGVRILLVADDPGEDAAFVRYGRYPVG